ncbi:MAG: hypothetical protein JKX73_09350 [Flavobacteriales bacterium]|nr:hypothetical protein [Flavobacteriales bacterium]
MNNIDKCFLELGSKTSRNLSVVFWILILCSQTVSSQYVNWDYLNPTPQGNYFGGIWFTDANTGYTVGGASNIFKTIDQGGEFRRTHLVDNNSSLYDVHFPDKNDGWAVGYPGIILHSSDAGEVWSSQNSPATHWLFDVHFVDSLNGWATGMNFTGPYVGIILNTGDGGTTWTTQYSSSFRKFRGVWFTDTLNGWAIGEANLGDMIIMKTIDGGSSWTTPYYYSPPNFAPNKFTGIFFTDPNNGWVTTQRGGIYYSSNYGGTWVTQGTGVSQLESVYFLDDDKGWAVGDNGTVISTVDGGSSWALQTSNTTNYLDEVYFTNSNSGYMVDKKGAMHKSTDGGATWSTDFIYQLTTDYVRNIFFSDENHGWILNGPNGVLLTTDAGGSWVNKSTGAPWQDRDLFFIDSLNGCVVGDGGVVRRTTDGGNTWAGQSSGTGYHLLAVHFSDSMNGWAAGADAEIIHTSNGGISWTSQHYDEYNNITDICFVDSLHGWTSGVYGSTHRTSDGGITWTEILAPTTNNLTRIQFIDTLKGWATTESGYVAKTIDGGLSWTLYGTGNSADLYALHFIDSLRGWVGGSNSNVFYTLDGGITWTIDTYGREVSCQDIFFSNNYTAWMAGGIGKIFGGKTCKVDLGFNKRICSGDSVLLDPGSGYTTYDWNDGASNNQQLYAKIEGSYKISVTDSNGCIVTDVVEVYEDTLPAPDLGVDTSFCIGNAHILLADSGDSYLWNDSSNHYLLSVNASGTYYVTAENSCGLASDTIDITVTQLPVVDLGNDTTICSGDSISLVAGLNVMTFLWSDSSTDSSLTSFSADTFFVQVTDSQSCVNSDTIAIDVSAPSVDIGADTLICTGIPITLIADLGFVTYLWSDSSTNQSTLILAADSLVYVTAIDIYTCAASDSLLITTEPLPIIDSIIVTRPSACGNTDGVIEISASGGTPPFQYSIDSGVTFSFSTSFTGLDTGSFTPLVSDSNYCALAVMTIIDRPELNSTNSFAKTFGESANDIATTIESTLDGGLIISGTTISYGSGSYDLILIKTDSIGDTLWTKVFEGLGAGYTIRQLADSGFAIAGVGSTLGGQYILKIDVLGNLIWEQGHSAGSGPNPYSMVITTDGGFLLAGKSRNLGPGNDDFYILKTDSVGAMQWAKTYGVSGDDDIAYSAKQTLDGGYIVVGSKRILSGSYPFKILLLKLDSVGTLEWANTYWGSGSEHGKSVLVADDGGYIIAGSTTSFGQGGGDVLLMKTNSSGAV